MTDLATGLHQEMNRREAAFLSKLQKNGHLELLDEYRAINTLRDALGLLSKQQVRGRARVTGSTPTELQDDAPDGFVLSDEIRKVIRNLAADRFRASTVYELLAREWPDYVTLDKRGSIGATLSNFAGAGELTTERDGQRKVWYRVANLRGGDSDSDTGMFVQVQPNSQSTKPTEDTDDIPW